MNIEPRQIAPYLPYGLEVILSEEGILNLDCEYGTPYQARKPMKIIEVIIQKNGFEIEIHSEETNWGVGFIELSEIKPILHPLTDLNKMITYKGVSFIPVDEFFVLLGGGVSNDEKSISKWKQEFVDNILYSTIGVMPYFVFNKLIEWHFDVFGLLANDLAIDINTL